NPSCSQSRPGCSTVPSRGVTAYGQPQYMIIDTASPDLPRGPTDYDAAPATTPVLGSMALVTPACLHVNESATTRGLHPSDFSQRSDDHQHRGHSRPTVADRLRPSRYTIRATQLVTNDGHYRTRPAHTGIRGDVVTMSASGSVAERPIALDLKSSEGNTSGSSNLPAS